MTRSRTRRYPPEYRQEEVGRVMDRWRACESCSLVGVGSVGKSNIMQHLADPDIQKAYMKEAKVQNFKAIIIDPSMLGSIPTGGPDAEQVRCWSGYELLMHRLFMAFYNTPLLDERETRRFADLYRNLQDGTNPLYAAMGLRYFELGLDIFMQRGIHIVFMFDEFEEMIRQMPVKFFLTLRGLRDMNKKQLSYLTFTRSPLPEVINREKINHLEIEQFIELFTDNLYYVGPFNDTDARRMIDELQRRNEDSYDEYALNWLLWATGRYAGLLRAGYRAIASMDELRDPSVVMTQGDRLAKELAQKNPVRTESQTIWDSLSRKEQVVLCAAVGLTQFQQDTQTKDAVELLVHKKLLRKDKYAPNGLSVEPPVFYYFVLGDPDLRSDE